MVEQGEDSASGMPCQLIGTGAAGITMLQRGSIEI